MKPARLFAILAAFSVLLSCGPARVEPDPEPAPVPAPEPAPEPEELASYGAYKHVVIIGVDGAGAFFSESVTPMTYMIFKSGASTGTAQAAYPSISAQCWGSMLHGVPPVAHRLTNTIAGSRPYDIGSPYPSIFRIAREHLPYANLASFCNWNPINYGIIEDSFGVVKSTADTDEEITTQILSYLDRNLPTLMFVQYDSVDGAGHSSGYGSSGHLQTLTKVDNMIWNVFNAIKNNGILDDTLFIVTADHGGTPGGSHGGGSKAEMDVFLGVYGKTTPAAGAIVDAEGQDVAAIAAYALGIPAPEVWTSRVPAGVFTDVAGSERKKLVIPVSEFRKHENVPTPEIGAVRKLLSGHKPVAYLPFDGSEADALGITSTVRNGKAYYYDGYFGSGIKLEDGYVSLKDVSFGTGSFSLAFWIKADKVDGDPSIISNKNWDNGGNDGFVLSLRSGDIKFNAGCNAKGIRMDSEAPLPADCNEGWMHVALVVNREKNVVRIYYDFKLEVEASISAAMRDVSFDALELNIGQDGTGRYSSKLPAQLDEMIITADVLSDADMDALKEYYR